MTEFYGPAQRALQDEFDTRALADTFEGVIVSDAMAPNQREFIESRDFFFLSSVDDNGWPTVSYKGGPVGVVKAVDEKTLRFPSYDGNGMYLSMGNIDIAAKIGLLFIDFETPTRLRVQAQAQLLPRDHAAMSDYPGADLVVEAKIESVYDNCARYVHRHTRVETSPYVPDDDGDQPFPSWKRIDLIQPVLPERDQGIAESTGGTITGDEYGRRLSDGTS